MSNCLWRAESVEILMQVLNQMVAGQGPAAAGWYDHRFGGRGVVGTAVGAYSTGGSRGYNDSTLVIVLEGHDGNRVEVHWRDVGEASSIAYWLSLILRTIAGKHVEGAIPLHDDIAVMVAAEVYRCHTKGGSITPEDLPAWIDRAHRKVPYDNHVVTRPLDLPRVPMVK